MSHRHLNVIMVLTTPIFPLRSQFMWVKLCFSESLISRCESLVFFNFILLSLLSCGILSLLSTLISRLCFKPYFKLFYAQLQGECAFHSWNQYSPRYQVSALYSQVTVGAEHSQLNMVHGHWVISGATHLMNPREHLKTPNICNTGLVSCYHPVTPRMSDGFLVLCHDAALNVCPYAPVLRSWLGHTDPVLCPDNP